MVIGKILFFIPSVYFFNYDMFVYHLFFVFYNHLTFFFSAKPIDLLAKYISAEDDALAVEMHEPYTYLYVSFANKSVYSMIFLIIDIFYWNCFLFNSKYT
jgi:hypothetical protein